MQSADPKGEADCGAQIDPAAQSNRAGASDETHARALMPHAYGVTLEDGIPVHVPPTGAGAATLISALVVKTEHMGRTSTFAHAPACKVTSVQRLALEHVLPETSSP